MNKLNFGISISAVAIAMISFAFAAGVYYKSIDVSLADYDKQLKNVTDTGNSLQSEVTKIENDLIDIRESYQRINQVKFPIDEREFLFQSGSHTTPGARDSKFYQCFFELKSEKCDIDNKQSVYRKKIKFEKKFEKIPKVHVALRYIEAKPNEMIHIFSKPENVSESGFTLLFKSPKTSLIKQVGFIWFAYTSPQASHSELSQ